MFLQVKLPSLPRIYTNITGGLHLQNDVLTIVLLDTPEDNPERWQLVNYAQVNMSENPQLNSSALEQQLFPIFWHGCCAEVRTIPLILPADTAYDDVVTHAEMKFKEIPDHEAWQWELWISDNDDQYELYVTEKKRVAMMQTFLAPDLNNLLESWFPVAAIAAQQDRADSICKRYQQQNAAIPAAIQPAIHSAIASVIAGIDCAECI